MHGGIGRRSPRVENRSARRVLVVDDSRDLADSLAMFLEGYGSEVRTAYDGRGALAIAAAFEPEVAFLDIELPDLSGCDVAFALRQTAHHGVLLLVATTALGSEQDRRRIQSAGFDHYLQKPFSLDQVERLMSQLP
jgi:DNA-binding response OmpR family regulator